VEDGCQAEIWLISHKAKQHFSTSTKMLPASKSSQYLH